jgi:hypothetical protein
MPVGPRGRTNVPDSGDSFYGAVSAVRAAAAAPRGLSTPRTDAQMDRAAGVSRTAAPVVDESTRIKAQAAARSSGTPAPKTDAQKDAELGVVRGRTDSAATVDEQTKAREKAAQAPKTEPAFKDDPYYKRDPITGLSPAQVEALQAQRDAAAAKAEAIDEYYRMQNELNKLKGNQGDGNQGDGNQGDGNQGDGNQGDGNAGDGSAGAGNTGSGNAGADTTIPGTGVGPGAGGAGPESAATNAILDQIKVLTEQLKQQQAAAAAEAAKPKVIGTRTVRKTGGVVQVVEQMSDGTTGKVIEEYKDFGARDSVMKMFENTGLGKTFIDSLMATIDKVYEDNIMPTEAQVLNTIYSSDAYKTRFAGNEIIRKRMADGKGLPGDRLLTPAEYIRTEDAYKEIMSEAGLPAYFYDQPEDYAKFIGELGTSVAEITERVNIAKQALQNADQNIKTALQQYYGLSEGDLVAYLLDPEKAFRAIDSRFAFTTEDLKRKYQTAEIGGAATRAGMGTGVSKGFAEEILKAGKGDLAERAFQGAAREQEDYQRLMSLYGETAGTEDLAREALALAGGAEVGIKTKKLASKERAKFQQQSAIDKTSLGSRLRSPDV